MRTPRPSARPVYASALGRPVFFGAVAMCVAVVVARLCGVALPAYALPLCVGLLLSLIGLGNFYMPSGVFARPLLRGPALRPRIALTFDDGPDPVSTPKVLAALSRHGARATFFVIGERAAQHPRLIAEIAAASHQLENHSLRHSWATPFAPRARLAAELLETQRIIESAQAGVQAARPPRWFRPPIGILSPEVAAAARRAGLRLCGWSAKARDGLGSTGAAAALARLQPKLEPGAILLLHDAAERGGHDPVAPAVLDKLLPALAERGLSAVTLDELMDEKDLPQRNQ